MRCLQQPEHAPHRTEGGQHRGRGRAGENMATEGPSFYAVKLGLRDGETGHIMVQMSQVGRWRPSHLRAANAPINCWPAHWRPVLTAVINSTPHNPGFWTRQESELRTCIPDQAHTPPQQASSPPDPGLPAREIPAHGGGPSPPPVSRSARCLMNPLPILWLSERRGSGLPPPHYHSKRIVLQR